jgi:CHASE2 domain-containing sensor protein
VGKITTLEFNEGSFEQGFRVTLRIGDFGAPIHTKVTGKLPPNLDVPRAYRQWRSHYTNLLANPALKTRPICLPKSGGQSTPDDCEQAARQVSDMLNQWLRSESFLPIWHTWLRKIKPTDDLRILLQTDDSQLQKLPWHLWDLFTQYPNAELALSAVNYDAVNYDAVNYDAVNYETVAVPAPAISQASSIDILAILGNSEGIDIETDRTTLSKIPDASVKFLREPALKDLTDELWQQPWRILFFAGHSGSAADGNTGKIAVNPQESLSIDALKYALRHAVQRGLQLAIFNSCEGLGLTQTLSELQIPNIIVMRESVPDIVAQAFLTYFLTAFSQGQSLHASVRQAREQLQSLENQYPCATWLPVLYQNPAEIALTWNRLTPRSHPSQATQVQVSSKFQISKLLQSIGLGAIVAASVLTLREFGGLQPLELMALDGFLRSRPPELTDSRLLIIGIDNTDVKADETLRENFQIQQRGGGSISNATLEKLIKKLTAAQPSLIGLDIYRDFPVNDQPTIAKRLQNTPNLIAICRSSDTQTEIPGVKPPPGISDDRLGFSDFVSDPDGVVRRHLLFMDPEPASPCAASYAFSVQIAATYLSGLGVEWMFTPGGNLKLGSREFSKLQPRSGGYSAIDTGGNQILLNYHAAAQPFNQVTLRQMLNGEVPAHAIKDRIVLIGYTGKGVNDYSPTPYGEMPGVIIHAHMIHQILSAVQHNRSILWSWPKPVEMLWILAWALISSLVLMVKALMVKTHNVSDPNVSDPNVTQIWTQGGIVVVLLSSGVSLFCYLLLLQGGWVPWVPAVAAIALTTLTRNVIQMRSLNPSRHQDAIL